MRNVTPARRPLSGRGVEVGMPIDRLLGFERPYFPWQIEADWLRQRESQMAARIVPPERKRLPGEPTR